MSDGFKIVVASHGFVYVGDVRVDGQWLIVADASNVRRWGTSRGLGQLALEGPQSGTVLDRCGVVRIPLSSVVHLIDAENSRWKAS